MAQLIVTNLEEEIVRRLQVRAAEHGCSMETEHRSILRIALGMAPTEEQDFKAALLAMPDIVTDADFERDQDLGREVELSA
jgi:plasmid stability protein